MYETEKSILAWAHSEVSSTASNLPAADCRDRGIGSSQLNPAIRFLVARFSAISPRWFARLRQESLGEGNEM